MYILLILIPLTQADIYKETLLMLNDASGPIEELLENSELPDLQDSFSLQSLAETFLTGDSKLGINRNYTVAYFLLMKASSLGNTLSLLYLATIFKEMSLTDEFSELDSIMNFTLTEKSEVSYESGIDALAVSYLSLLSQCQHIKKASIPSYLNSPIIGTGSMIDLIVEYEYSCEVTQDLAHIALYQAYHSRNHIEATGATPPSITRAYLENPQLYGEETSKLTNLLEKHFEANSNTKGLISLGQDALNGNKVLGINQDPEAALKYFQKAMELGDVESAAQLGKMLYKGLGVERNITKAVEYYEKAANGGSVEALRQLSILYERGEGVVRNLTRAFELSMRAAAAGDIQSLNNVGVYYLYGSGVEKNGTKGVEYINKSANLGSYAAKYNLGCVYYHGEFVEKSLTIAFYLFLDVVYGAQPDGFMAKAYKFFKEGDLKSSYIYYLLAAKVGYQEARTSLAYFFENGLNGNKCKFANEYCVGYYLISAIAQNNDSWANMKLGAILFYGGDRIKPNYEEAYMFYLNGPESGESLYKLGYMNEHGFGREKNYDKALEFYRRILESVKENRIPKENKWPATIAIYFLYAKRMLYEVLGIE